MWATPIWIYFHCLQDFEDHFANHEINNSRSSKSHLASSVLLLYSFMFDIYGIPITIYKMGFQISSPLEWSQSQVNASVSSVRLLTVTYMIFLKTLLCILIMNISDNTVTHVTSNIFYFNMYILKMSLLYTVSNF